MSKIRPSGFDVTLTYQCPDCDSEHFSTIEETIFPAGILCYCGKKLKLESIYGFDVVCKYNNTENESPENNAPNMSFVEQISDALVGLGYNKREAIKKAKEAAANNSDLDSCIKQAIG